MRPIRIIATALLLASLALTGCRTSQADQVATPGNAPPATTAAPVTKVPASAAPATSALRLLDVSAAKQSNTEQVNHRRRHHCRWYRGHRHCWWGPRRHRHCWRWDGVRLCAHGDDRLVIRIR